MINNVKNIGQDDFKKVLDPDKLRSNLLTMNKLTKVQSVATCFSSLDIGTSYPNYSDYTLSNVPINGFSTVLDFKKIHLTFSKGNLKKSIISTDPF